ncbi:hypothetical protein Corgl_1593 [Coriobacterium glomerans PW2]|uniref:Apiosidase-like catalytic domain-containing protein n=1 Tax=Coriobacterium glomerans (strain ATCC 49209 / DSM 20642 / JCM 10262 / PW2) TaxID=700015 RepID=F2N916_CORGP|nr:DUF4038 domain-containing protein [Coriobacterium glomerans]AEB07692.1 hypothetical protein Corgl_1593 [Coriobacterium glomerans PW2]
MALGSLSVNKRGDGFLLDGQPWFWTADTCWSAFTSIALDDWDYYLERRAEQGFNTVQINTLPQWDRCRPDLGVYPYASEDGVKFDWSAPNPAWWERARTMCEMAHDRGIRPALVLIWCNYVPGTWASDMAASIGIEIDLMPISEALRHIERVVHELGRFDPIYIVSGDTDFKTDQAIDYYDSVLKQICACAPASLRTMHICGGSDSLPERYLDRLDFYLFQSGHNIAKQSGSYRLPETFRARYPKKPLINSEPCYEQIGPSRHVSKRFVDGDARAAMSPIALDQRFSARDVRAALWSSVLAGAVAGVSYGAHGIWNWQTSRSDSSALGEGFDAPFRWQEALQFSGAWDAGALGLMLEILGATSSDEDEAIEPAPELLDDEREEIRAARIGERIVIYVPRTTSIAIRSSLAGCNVQAIALENRRVARLPFSSDDKKGCCARIAQHPFEHDALIVISPRTRSR